MLGYDFKIQYRPNCENKATDVLSQTLTFEREMQAILTTQVIGTKGINQEVIGVEKLQGIIQDLLKDPNSHESYSFRVGSLFYKGRIVLPKNLAYIPRFLAEFHSYAIGDTRSFFKLTKA